jgi:hypothetical protein
MKRSLVFLSLCCVLMVAFWSVNAAAPANFSGTWSLDKAKSEGLQGRMANVDQTWVVTQDGKTISIDKSFTGGEQPIPSRKSTFNLDGSETSQEMTGRMPGKAALKAKWQGDGKILELSSVLKANVQGNDVTITTTEHWELHDGGKTLKVHFEQETPRGKQESKLTFVKK